MIQKVIAATLCSLLLLACANNQTASPSASSLTTGSVLIGSLQGKVTIGPLCPVESADNPCLPDPTLFTSHELVILSANGTEVGRVNIDGQGNYRTDLLPGTYTVDFSPHDIGIPGTFQPPRVEIRQGETVILNIEIDTGIR